MKYLFFYFFLFTASFSVLATSPTQDTEDYFFAYGGYLDDSQLIEDLGYLPESLGVYKLDNYEFCYNRAPTTRNATGGNIQSIAGKTVFGVIWKIKKSDFIILDKEEQAPIVYQRYQLKFIHVGPPHDVKMAQVYIANPQYISSKCFPRRQYVNDMVIKGAKKHHLPKDYIDTYLRWSGPWGIRLIPCGLQSTYSGLNYGSKNLRS